MRPDRLWLRGIAAWLGVVALGFNALTPVHLAFDLAHALAPVQERAATDHDLVHCLLTVLLGHEEGDHTPAGKGHHDHDCAVGSAINTLAGFALPLAVMPAVPALVFYAQVAGPADPAAPRRVFATPYRSRAPPLV